VGALPALPIAAARRLVVVAWTTAVATSTAITARSISVAVVALVAVVSTPARARPARFVTIPPRPLLRDRFEVRAREQLEDVGATGLLLRRNDRQNADAFDVVLALGAQLVTDGSADGEDRSVEDALGLAGAGGAPRP
jgi:hypothetical protein